MFANAFNNPGLGQALRQAPRCMQLLQAGQLEDFSQISDRMRQPPVVGQHDDGLMNLEVGFVILLDQPSPGVRLQAFVQGAQGQQIGSAGVARGFIGAAPFQKRNHGENVVQVLLGDFTDKATAPRFVP